MNQITVRLPPEQKREMKRIRLIMVLIGVMMSGRLYAQPPVNDPKMTAFIDDLMSRMTPEEKIGQLNLLSVGFDVTGPRLSRDAESKVRHGLVGGVFNTYTPLAVRKLQSLAVKESRMGIPLLFGYDVIHGHKTVFPIPLGLSCTWNLDSIERSARIGAVEAGRDYNTVDMSRLQMYEYYLPPYQAAVDAGAGSVMSSFNEIDGVPA